MLTSLTVHGPITDPLSLPLTQEGREATDDILQLRDIDGLGPVKATVNTAPYATVSGAALTGSNVADRNIVLTLGPKPDWDIWTPSKIRTLAYKYFMPKTNVNLVFDSDDMESVQISGEVESCEPLIFSKDNEIQVSIICPDPNFVGIDAQAVSQNPSTGDPQSVEYLGTVETPMILKVSYVSGANTPTLGIHFGTLGAGSQDMGVAVVLGAAKQILEINSIPGQKYVRSFVDSDYYDANDYVNELIHITAGSIWPQIIVGHNDFYITESGGVFEYEFQYFDRFGGL